MAKATNAAVMNDLGKPAMSHGATVPGRTTAKSMKAAVAGEFGKTLVFDDRAVPEPGIA